MNSNTMKLYGLAMNKFGKITKAEAAFFQRIANAEHVTYKKDTTDEPIIRASCIAWICKDPQASSMVKNSGIGINGARIEGDLELSYAKIPFPLIFQKCLVPGNISLYNAEIHSLDISQSHIGSINAERLKVIVSVILSGTEVRGEVKLSNAEIGGNLNCGNAHFINNQGIAISAVKMKVGGLAIFNDEFKAEGMVDLRGAIIGSNLQCSNSQFINSTGRAFCAETMKVEGCVYMTDMKANGEVSFAGAKILLNLECDNAQLINKDGRPFCAQQLMAGGHVSFTHVQAKGNVNFDNAKIFGSLACNGSQIINKCRKGGRSCRNCLTLDYPI